MILGILTLGSSPLGSDSTVSVGGTITIDYTKGVLVLSSNIQEPISYESILYTKGSLVLSSNIQEPTSYESIVYTKGNLVLGSSTIIEPSFRLNISPITIFPGYTFDGTNIIIPIAEIKGLLSSEANTSTGNWINLVQSLLFTYDDYLDIFSATYLPKTVDSFLLQNPNTSRPNLSPLPLWLNTFLEHFTVTYAQSNLKAEN